MSRPDPRQNAAVSAPISGAVDLSGLKARADAAGRTSASAGSGQPSAAPGAGGSFVIDVDEQSFQAEVVERSMQVPVIVDLWATWCGPCKQLSPVLEKLAAEAGGSWILAKVDVDQNQRIAQVFGVQSIPTVVAIAGGQPIEAFQGAQPEPQVRQWINSLIDKLREQLPGIKAAESARGDAAAEPVPEPEDPRFIAAESAFENGDYAAASAAYEQILAVEPANEDAKAALAQVRLAARAESAGPDAIAKAEAAPADLDAQLAAADVEMARARVEAAFARLVAAVQRSTGEDRNRVREHLVELFDMFPPDDPRVSAARQALARALF